MADFRSDTVTKPSPEMLAAMLKADLGDDVYGDDPTVNNFEKDLAEMFGKQAALFTPTGSMANQIAIRLLVKPGEELLTETNSHIVRAELGAAATFSGITREPGAPIAAYFMPLRLWRLLLQILVHI